MGKGNLCSNCHQPRIPDPMPVKGGDDVILTSTRWGIHHGPQSALVAGTAGYEFEGESYGSNPHAGVDNTCITCHMAKPYGAQAGGHTMKMAYDLHGTMEYNIAGCTECHDDDIVNKLETKGEEVEELLVELQSKLIANGVLNESGSIIINKKISADNAGALLNYLLVEEDRSFGVHNPTYIVALLKNSIAGI